MMDLQVFALPYLSVSRLDSERMSFAYLYLFLFQSFFVVSDFALPSADYKLECAV